MDPANVVINEMVGYWYNRVDPDPGDTLLWKPHYEGYVQKVAQKARELDWPLHALPSNHVVRLSKECCASYCALVQDEPVLVPPPDMHKVEVELTMPDGCDKPEA